MQNAPFDSMAERVDLAGRKVFAFQIRRWKQAILNSYFPRTNFSYLPLYVSDKAFFLDWAQAIEDEENPVLLTWGNNVSPAVVGFARDNRIPLCFLEDGFIRSLVPNASHSLPFSLTLDGRAPYFDSRSSSDLEIILSNCDFEADQVLMSRARKGIAELLSSGLSKYNSGDDTVPPPETTPASPRRRILVIGQVEDDASIRFGCDRKIDNNDVVRLAAQENPDCDILYKPHPDVLNGVRRRLSNPADVAHVCHILIGKAPLPEVLRTVDHVYTITSLGGFEALLRGIPVTLLGCPFYAGWGLTDDRQANSRRKRRLSIDEVFAAAYLLYPRYFDPVSGEEATFEECLSTTARWRRDGMPQSQILPVPTPTKPGFAITGSYGLLGWRHLMTWPLANLIARVGDQTDAEAFKTNPIVFFRELSNARLRKLGRILYPFD
ncbi:capsular polysaccharide export protein, LipB/KpsS family [Rhizobium populisoli]|uniref:capsular polysaccharide export protein, LipB/KpsS family n=1 Tax=Rhizobium populisoli TaxID=2859785 RepID=UPI001FEA8352|nr:capsular polysaccharide biosynthesis protein [Rhizobium populisoli]